MACDRDRDRGRGERSADVGGHVETAGEAASIDPRKTCRLGQIDGCGGARRDGRVLASHLGPPDNRKAAFPGLDRQRIIRDPVPSNANCPAIVPDSSISPERAAKALGPKAPGLPGESACQPSNRKVQP